MLTGWDRRRVVGAVVAVVVLALVAFLVLDGGPDVTRRDVRIEVADGVELDATWWVPAGADADAPAAAVLVAHGFGGDKQSVADDARLLAAQGFAVLAWSSRGFGASDGVVGLQDPGAEVADVSALVDWLAGRDEVVRDGPDDPRVGMTGASYGGGATLLGGAAEPRLDALVAVSAWHDLSTALAPNQAEDSSGDAADGVLKLQWASSLFTVGAAPGGLSGLAGGAVGDGDRAAPTTDVAGPCGRFDPALCRAYAASAEQGRLDPDARDLLARADLTDERLAAIDAPTLVVHGRADTLFPLSGSVDNATGIAADGTTARLAWLPGGHALDDDDVARVRDLRATWFDRWLATPPDELADDPPPGSTFTSVDRLAGEDRAGDDLAPATATTTLALSADGALVAPDAAASGSRSWLRPPGGVPATLTSLPGLGGLGDLLPSVDLPGQHVAFDTAPLEESLDVVGAPTLDVEVGSDGDEVVLFAKVLDVAPDGSATLPQQAVAPVRSGSGPTRITLSTLDHEFTVGHRLRVVLASTDQAFSIPTSPASFTVETGPAAVLEVPSAPAGVVDRGPLLVALAVLALLAGAVAAVAWWRGRSLRRAEAPPDPTAPAVEVRDLRKSYANGFVAVDGVDLVVEPGQVFGLLGPNGAGKTSTLRMVLGLSMPTAGTIDLLGHRVTPGHPVLQHVGALVEGPGFAPYRSGWDNLHDFWRAGPWSTGLAEANLERALEVAALGEAIHRPVGTYSHGMRQRLGIAQALLGDPPLLILDEPTDGLDPGQIRGMRDLLAGLATEGRTVLVSSHLLAEVEQVCSHAAVLVNGRVVASGPVADLGGETRTVEVRADDAARARDVLADLVGEARVQRQGSGVLVDLDGGSVTPLVAALVDAGVGVRAVTPRRRLEDAFLRLVDGSAAKGSVGGDTGSGTDGGAS